MSAWRTPDDAAARWPHLKLSAPMRDHHMGKGVVTISPGCNCVLLTTYVPFGTAGRIPYHGSFGSIDDNSAYEDYVAHGEISDLRPFLSAYRTFPPDAPPGAPPIPHAFEKWLDRCERAMAAFAGEPGR